MPTLKIPGVYVQEVPTLPPGVAEVNSAVPAFIGYTLTTKFNDQDLKYQPIKVQSMLEYVRFFGESSPFTIEGVTADLTQTANEATVSNHFYLYDSLQLYFLNGGGPCYIVSIGTYAESSDSDEPYIKGLDTLDLHDEPTLYLFPDAVLLPDDSLAKVQQVSLRKCGELMDRFSILDVKRNTSKTSTLEAVANFRNKIGMGNLNYGAAYTPWLSTTLGKTITVASINNIFTILNSLPVSLLNTEINGSKISASISDYKKLFDNLNTLAANPTIKDIAATYSDAIEAYVSGAKKTKNPFDAAELFKPVLEFTITSGSLQIFWDDNVKSQINTWKEELVEKTKDVTDEEKASAKENYLLGVLNSTNFERFTDLNRYVRNGLQKIVTTYETFLIDNIPFYASLLKVLNNKLTELPPS